MLACLTVSGILDIHHPAPAPGSLEERIYTGLLSQPTDDALLSPICWSAARALTPALTFDLCAGEHDSPAC